MFEGSCVGCAGRRWGNRRPGVRLFGLVHRGLVRVGLKMRGVFLAIGALVITAFVVGCGGSSPQPTGTAGTVADASALSVRARQIVDAWVADVAVLDRGGTPSGMPGLRREGYVTPALVEQAEAAGMGGAAGGYDLMSCSQNPLNHYDLGAPSIVDGRGKVDVMGVYSMSGPIVFTYEFVKTPDGWKLDHVVCPAP